MHWNEKTNSKKIKNDITLLHIGHHILYNKQLRVEIYVIIQTLDIYSESIF